MKNVPFHLPNEGLQDLESFMLICFFYAHINTSFSFYILDPLQVVSWDPIQCFDAVEIR